MKVTLRLAILVATLLLVANMAFANGICDQTSCYDIIITDEYGNTTSYTWVVCLNNEDGTGSGHNVNNTGYFDLYLFGGGPGWFNTSGSPAIGGNPGWTTWILRGEDESGLLQPIGDGYMLTGEGEREGIRSTLQGMKVPCNFVP